MRSIAVLALLVLSAAWASAADEDAQGSLSFQQKAELERLRRELKLEDGQAGRIRAAFVESNRHRDEKIREILTPEQAARYEELRKEAGGAGARMRFGFPGGGMAEVPSSSFSFSMSGGGLEGLTAGKMREKLELDEDQFKAVGEILAKYRDETAAAAKEAVKNFDFEAVIEKLGKLKDDAVAKIRKLLTDKQKSGFEKMLEDASRAPGGAVVIGGDGSVPPELRKMTEDLKSRLGGVVAGPAQRPVPEILKELRCSEDEAAIIGPRIEKIRAIEAESSSAEANAASDLKEFIGKEKPSDDAIRSKIEELRAKRAESKRRIAEARKELIELLTFEQEARLLIMGILE